MKKLFYFALLLAFGAQITGCTNTPTAPEESSTGTPEVSLVSPAPARQAATITVLPLNSIRSADCTGELVKLSGTILLVSQTQPDGSIVGNFNYQDAYGIGLTSGTVYRVSAVNHLRLSAPFPTSIISMGSFRLISQGSDSNLLVRVIYHVTVNGNGEVTVSIDTLDMECV